MAFYFFILAFFVSLAKAQSDPGIVKITETLCSQKHEEKVAIDFYSCYNQVLDQNENCIFDTCQKSIFGCTLSSKKNVESACAASAKLPKYVECLVNNFKSCSKDFDSALKSINICQGRVLGIN